MPRISLIAAIGKNRELGKDNRLLWKLPADMAFFKRNTSGKPIIVGRKTYESFFIKPLPGRMNIVITRDDNYSAPGAIVVHSIEEALQQAKDAEEIMIVGGASFYAQMLPRADRLYLTLVESNTDADSWFPEYDVYGWQEILNEPHLADEKNPINYTFVILDRFKRNQTA